MGALALPVARNLEALAPVVAPAPLTPWISYSPLSKRWIMTRYSFPYTESGV